MQRTLGGRENRGHRARPGDRLGDRVTSQMRSPRGEGHEKTDTSRLTTFHSSPYGRPMPNPAASIDDYDGLTAQAITRLLDSLDRRSLLAVRERELAGKARVTVLRRVDSLLARNPSVGIKPRARSRTHHRPRRSVPLEWADSQPRRDAVDAPDVIDLRSIDSVPSGQDVSRPPSIEVREVRRAIPPAPAPSRAWPTAEERARLCDQVSVPTIGLASGVWHRRWTDLRVWAALCLAAVLIIIGTLVLARA
jgi:hypothetical protein